MNTHPVTHTATPLATKQTQLRREHQELEQMLQHALRSARGEQNRQHLQLSRQHNNRLLDYRLALLDACEQFGISSSGLQIQYDPITQLFEVHTPQNPVDRFVLERALNQQKLPVLARCTRDFLDVTRALATLEQTPAQATAPQTQVRKETDLTTQVA